MARSLVLTVLVVAAVLISAVSVDASYWSDEVARVRAYTAEYYLDRMAKKPDVSALPSGLLFTVLERGHGDRAPAADDMCDVHYTIHHRYPGVIDDTRGKAYPLRRSPSQLLPGMAEAMQLMREGDRWYLYVPAKLAYGAEGWKERNVGTMANVRVDMQVLKCQSLNGKTSAEVDAYLAPFLKKPMPAKAANPSYDRDL